MPGTSARGSSGITTTFEGAGVASGGTTTPPEPLGPPTIGMRPVSRTIVTTPTMSRPNAASIGPTRAEAGARPYGSRGVTGRRLVGRVIGYPRRDRGRHLGGDRGRHLVGRRRDVRPLDLEPARRGDVADLELERLVAAERPADEAGHDVDPIALEQATGQVVTAEGDAVEDVRVAAQHELGVAAVRRLGLGSR